MDVRGSDEMGAVLFAFFVAIVYGLWRLIKKVFRSGVYEEEEKKEGQEGSSKPFVKKEFFIKSLTRRRRLDLTRKRDNILSGKLGKKVDRHRRGMFGK